MQNSVSDRISRIVFLGLERIEIWSTADSRIERNNERAALQQHCSPLVVGSCLRRLEIGAEIYWCAPRSKHQLNSFSLISSPKSLFSFWTRIRHSGVNFNIPVLVTSTSDLWWFFWSGCPSSFECRSFEMEINDATAWPHPLLFSPNRQHKRIQGLIGLFSLQCMENQALRLSLHDDEISATCTFLVALSYLSSHHLTKSAP